MRLIKELEAACAEVETACDKLNRHAVVLKLPDQVRGMSELAFEESGRAQQILSSLRRVVDEEHKELIERQIGQDVWEAGCKAKGQERALASSFFLALATVWLIDAAFGFDHWLGWPIFASAAFGGFYALFRATHPDWMFEGLLPRRLV